jgi:hypothetical protein
MGPATLPRNAEVTEGMPAKPMAVAAGLSTGQNTLLRHGQTVEAARFRPSIEKRTRPKMAGFVNLF